MKVWVDYTNWKGVREWREIRGVAGPRFTVEAGSYNHEDGTHEATWVMHVSMVDRDGARRTLKLTSIHGFHIGEVPPHALPR